jgi:V8-like Glu-specific endopeptidase
MLRRSALVMIGAAMVVAALPGASSAQPAPRGAAAEHRRIVDSWTPANRAAAIPRDKVRPGAPVPNAKPGTGGGGGGTVAGATWTGGGQVAKTTGKLFFVENGVRYTCSGSAVSAGGVNMVLTAGHCVHGGGSGQTFVSDWVFYPAYGSNPANPPYGAWTATDLFTTSLWATSASGWNDDAGFAVVTNGAGGSLATVLGALPTVTFAAQAPTTPQAAFGYPASKQYNSGNVLTYCSGPTVLTYDSNDTYGMSCNMTGGSSGGPWLTGVNLVNGSGGTITSLNSYGYASLKNVMFGPIFGSGELSVYTAASAGDCTPSATCVDYAD